VGLNLNIYNGQVLALLGHNGAGKTTTISMLTGLFSPTSGDAWVNGLSIVSDMREIQRTIGVCPQHNCLWEELTAAEHLKIFASIKGVPKEQHEALVEEKLKSVLLFDVANKKAGLFSGGMKRRLSVAISSVGNPKVLFLDEPTTGLDPMSRREIWGAIQRLKKNRVVVLTTHSMEEADILGDRIAIMAHGKLKCIGTSLHLKNKFGLGYRLNLSARPEQQEQLKSIVTERLPGAVLIAETGGNLIYGVTTSLLPLVVPFFQFMEGHKDDGNFLIRDWGMSQTTLEEVFLKVTN